VDEGSPFHAVHVRQDPPERGIGGDHGTTAAEPLLGALVAGEQVDLVEALLSEGERPHKQQEDAGDGDHRALAGLEETLGLEPQVELVGAETGEV
jgi:hypothetical protein